MIIHKSQHTNKGFALVWGLVWALGLSALLWVTVSYAMPRFENKQRSAVIRTVSQNSKTPVSVRIDGFTATLSGKLADEQARQAIVSSLGVHSGIFKLTDNLQIADDAALPGGERKNVEIAPLTETDNNTAASLTPTPDSAVDQAPLIENTDRGEDKAKALPSVSIRVAGDILQVDGVLASEEDSRDVIMLAMDAFDLDIVSNGIKVDDSVAETEWLSSLETLIPMMSSLHEPQLDILQQQVTLGGQTHDRRSHDTIIKQALSLLGSYSIIERIAVDETLPETQSEDLTSSTTIEPLAVNDASSADTSDTRLELAEPEPVAEPEPETPKSALQERLDELASLRIQFEPSSDVITPDSLGVLDQIADVLLQFPENTITIEGHTDTSGDKQSNLALSLSRATAVRAYLIEKGVSVFNLRAKGLGEEVPIADNNTAAGREINRRIEFKF